MSRKRRFIARRAVYHCAPPQIAPRAPRASRTGLLAQAVAALIPPPSKVRRPRHALRPAADPGHPRGRLRHRRPPASAMPGPVRRELRFCGKTLPAARGTAHPVIDRRPVTRPTLKTSSPPPGAPSEPGTPVAAYPRLPSQHATEAPKDKLKAQREIDTHRPGAFAGSAGACLDHLRGRSMRRGRNRNSDQPARRSSDTSGARSWWGTPTVRGRKAPRHWPLPCRTLG